MLEKGTSFFMQKTIPQVFFERVKKMGNKPALRHKKYGLWHAVTWNEYRQLVMKVAKSLIALGIEKEDKIAIIGENRIEWVICDIGIITAGAVTVGLYPTLSPEQILYIVNHSESKIIFAENEEQLDKILEIKNKINLKKIVVWDPKGLWGFSDPDVVFFDEFLKISDSVSDSLLANRTKNISPEDTAIIIYTSGTTGPPKGAMLSHKNILFSVNALNEANEATEKDEVLSYLPLSHIAERLPSVFHAINVGYTVNFVESMDTLLENLKEISPTIFFSVPRIWEKIHSLVEITIKDSTPLKKMLYKWASEVGKRYAEEKMEEMYSNSNSKANRNKKISLWQMVKYKFAYLLVLKQIKRLLGFSRTRLALCGAAPSAPELYIYFNGLGIPLLEGYGQTESTGIITINRINRGRFGTVGEKLKGVEIKIGEDDEILTKGPHVFKGYFKDPELTAQTLRDGWLYTGDIGKIEDGYLKILDRKKDIIITAGGKNITPAYIENKLKFSPYIQDAVVIGEGKKYLVALILIDEDNVIKWAQDNKIQFTTFQDLAQNQNINKLIREEIEKVNKTLSSVETIKRFALIPKRFYEEEGDITPTKKIKRKVIQEKYKELIDTLYR